MTTASTPWRRRARGGAVNVYNEFLPGPNPASDSSAPTDTSPTAGSDEPTDEEIQRVRRWECRTNGHQWELILTAGSNIPAFLVCSKCSDKYAVSRTDD